MDDSTPPGSPFHPDFPSLLLRHYEQLAKGSGISDDVIRARGYRSILGKKELRDLKFSNAQARPPGLLIPVWTTDGQQPLCVYRPDHPRRITPGKEVKYELPSGSSIRIDCPPPCLPQLGDPNVPLWITEGQKKADALASYGACTVALMGVWGFKGKNALGGTIVLDDLAYIAPNDRRVRIVFDSDIRDKRQVRQALEQLTELLGRKGAHVQHVNLPGGPQGEKVGVDDYLLAHPLEELEKWTLPPDVKLTTGTASTRTPLGPEETDLGDGYWYTPRGFFYEKPTRDGTVRTKLSNFSAAITERVLKDDGQHQDPFLTLVGSREGNRRFPPTTMAASKFSDLAWVISDWGPSAIICAGREVKDRLREAIQRANPEPPERLIVTHAGWRLHNGERVYCHGGGAIGAPDLRVELPRDLSGYRLPSVPDDPLPGLEASLRFLHVATADVCFPLLAAMYLAPLGPFLSTDFTLWLSGPSGSFKTTVAALALCHYGDFNYTRVPATWLSTANLNEYLAFVLKDAPLLVDDFQSGGDAVTVRQRQREAQRLLTAQGNQGGRGRLTREAVAKLTFAPRGLLISTGEEAPGGLSITARTLEVEMSRGTINVSVLNALQKERHLLAEAMAYYIDWLRRSYGELATEIPRRHRQLRDSLLDRTVHPRLPNPQASLLLGLELFLDCCRGAGMVVDDLATSLREQGGEAILSLGLAQGTRLREEGSVAAFREGLQTVWQMGRGHLLGPDGNAPPQWERWGWLPDPDGLLRPRPRGQPMGWIGDGRVYLLPAVTWQLLLETYRQRGEVFPGTKRALYRDLRSEGAVEPGPDNLTQVVWQDAKPRRVLVVAIGSVWPEGEAADSGQEGGQ